MRKMVWSLAAAPSFLFIGTGSARATCGSVNGVTTCGALAFMRHSVHVGDPENNPTACPADCMQTVSVPIEPSVITDGGYDKAWVFLSGFSIIHPDAVLSGGLDVQVRNSALVGNSVTYTVESNTFNASSGYRIEVQTTVVLYRSSDTKVTWTNYSNYSDYTGSLTWTGTLRGVLGRRLSTGLFEYGSFSGFGATRLSVQHLESYLADGIQSVGVSVSGSFDNTSGVLTNTIDCSLEGRGQLYGPIQCDATVAALASNLGLDSTTHQGLSPGQFTETPSNPTLQGYFSVMNGYWFENGYVSTSGSSLRKLSFGCIDDNLVSGLPATGHYQGGVVEPSWTWHPMKSRCATMFVW